MTSRVKSRDFFYASWMGEVKVKGIGEAKSRGLQVGVKDGTRK